jgi:hypothetical protein
MATLLTCVLEVPRSNLVRDADYPEGLPMISSGRLGKLRTCNETMTTFFHIIIVLPYVEGTMLKAGRSRV